MKKDACVIGVIAVAIALLIGLVGKHDYEDEVAALKMYCSDVKAGIYPDFKMQYEKECVDK